MNQKESLNNEKIILTNKEIELIIQNTNATMAMEGFEPADFSNELFREYAKGKITEEEMYKKIKEYVLNLKK